jgi:hypothetical protein
MVVSVLLASAMLAVDFDCIFLRVVYFSGLDQLKSMRSMLLHPQAGAT